MTALEIDKISKVFMVKQSLLKGASPKIHAVQSMSFSVAKGETLGIVGESGCGKSTLARMLVGLEKPTTGSIKIDGQNLDMIELNHLYQKVQYVFQDPSSSLNPRKTIQKIMEMPLKHLWKLRKTERDRRIKEIFSAVGLPEEFLQRYPHEFSGGQAQRIGIARAIAANPKIIILDEPVSALDVSIQAQVLNLLNELKKQLELTYVFISHDLSVIEAISDRVIVLYFGSIVEINLPENIFKAPRHPYTKLLADSAPIIGRPITGEKSKGSDLPNPLNPPKGCAFAERCPNATAICHSSQPKLKEFSENQWVACHHQIEY